MPKGDGNNIASIPERSAMIMASAVRIVEVSPRDGLQNIAQKVPTRTKVQLIEKLYDAGLRTIEATSIVSPKAVPQLSDCRNVLHGVRGLLSDQSVRLPVLVPNTKGLGVCSQYGFPDISVFVSASEGFSKANINCTVADAIERARSVVHEAKSKSFRVRGYVSCIFVDPFDGPTPPAAVLGVVKQLLDMGCYEISLGDTLGIGSPADVRTLIHFLIKNDIPVSRLAGHFHDTYGQGLANAWEAYGCGVRVFDSSVAGLGGCPFAPGAKGNLATEDLVYMFNRASVSVGGVNLKKLVKVGSWISNELSIKTGSRAGAALMANAAKVTKGTSVEAAPYSPRRQLAWALCRETEGLLIHRSDRNLRITMNRPKNGNALTAIMIRDIKSAFADAAEDSSISRVVIQGSGKFFCTGMDLTTDGAVGRTEGSSDTQFQILTDLLETIDNSPKVTIACLNGPAFGGGVGLAFACDMRLCTRTASVTLSEVKLGLCPATISKYVIREFGFAFAREAMLSARSISAEEMKSRGLVTSVAADRSQLAELIDSFITQLEIASPDASRMCKELVHVAWMHGGQPEQSMVIKRLFREMMKQGGPGDFGVAEFRAGRQADWGVYQSSRRHTKL